MTVFVSAISQVIFSLQLETSNTSLTGPPFNLETVNMVTKYVYNRPRSIYQYSSMDPRLSGKNCKFLKFLLFVNCQKRFGYNENNTKYRSLSRKPQNYVRILIYRTWPIATNHKKGLTQENFYFVNTCAGGNPLRAKQALVFQFVIDEVFILFMISLHALIMMILTFYRKEESKKGVLISSKQQQKNIPK